MTDSCVTILQPFGELVNPHIWTDSRANLAMRFAIFEALVKPNGGESHRGGLAESWHGEADARTWTLRLRPGVRFHDGSALTAQDVVATLEHACGADIPGAYGTDALLHSYLGEAEFQAIDDGAVRIVTPEPMADLLDLLVNIPIVPQHVLKGSDVSELIGTGPYCLQSMRPGQVAMRRSEIYWGPRPQTEEIVWQIEPELDKRLDALGQGKAGAITYVPPAQAGAIEAAGGRYVELKTPLCVIIMINVRSAKCADVRVRQALNHAVNVDEMIARLTGGHATRLNGPLSPQHQGTDPTVAPYAYDPARARQLLTDAGYPGGIELALEVPTSSPNESIPLAELLVAQYEQAGIRLKITVHEDRPAYAYMVKEKRFTDLCIFDSSPASTYRVLREKLNGALAGPWWCGYNDAEVDRLMARAWAAVDRGARTGLYRRITARVHAGAPWVFLYNPADGLAVGQGLQGWSVTPDGLLSFA